jgi:hypothetical protein
LSQFIFLLRVALARLGSILREGRTLPHTSEDPNLNRYEAEEGKLRPGMGVRSRIDVGEDGSGFARTVDGVRRMRSSHLEQRLLNSAQRIRQSRIIGGEGDFTDRRTSLAPNQVRIQVIEDNTTTEALALEDDRALTLDDIPKILAVEHAKERDKPTHSSRNPSTNSYEFNFMSSDGPDDCLPPLALDDPSNPPNIKYFSELSALEYFIVRHIAVLGLDTLLGELFNLEDLLELIETRKGTIWERFGKAFRSGGGEKKNVKKKGMRIWWEGEVTVGVFGIPLEVLIERNGSDSVMGSGPGSLRIPAFVDDSISAMRQMGYPPGRGVLM